jgi:VanZ family protein
MRKLLSGKTIVIGILCVAWLAVIFYNGTRQGEVSQRSSKEIVKVISKFINISPVAAERASIKFRNANFYVRKNAHFFQYLVLSILICAGVRQLKVCKSSEIFLVLFLLLLFPVADEFIQKYIPGRSSNILDIIIDFSGGVLGMFVFKIVFRSSKSQLKTKSYF